jgi:hypothetical protein
LLRSRPKFEHLGKKVSLSPSQISFSTQKKCRKQLWNVFFEIFCVCYGGEKGTVVWEEKLSLGTTQAQQKTNRVVTNKTQGFNEETEK